MSNIYQKPSIKPQRGQNGFDVSRHRSYSSPVGMLLPVFKDYANPGDKYKLNSHTFIRTEAIETAAFVRMKHHIDWFFVPITQLYSRWNEFFNGTNDIMTNMFPDSVNLSLPKANLLPLIKNTLTDNSTFFDDYNPSGAPDGRRIAKVDSFGVPLFWNFRRLFDMLGYGNVEKYNDVIPSNNSLSLPLLDFLAYHKIFHSHYRLTDWTPNNPNLYNVDSFYSTGSIIDNSRDAILGTMHYRPYRKDYFTNILPQPVFSQNFSSFIQSGLINSSSSGNNFTNIKGIIPEYPLLGSVGIQNLSKQINNAGNSDYIFGFSGYYGNSSGEQSINGLSAPQLRATFAIDKLARITAFAGGHYSDQILAHFGVELPKGIGDEAYYLGSQKSDIQINEVVATSTSGADGAGSVIGDIAGKAFAATQQTSDIDFTAPCHGIIMAISSIEVIPSYASLGCEAYNRKSTMFDFYKPELDDLGMQPMFGDFIGESFDNTQSLSGWTYRYSEYKTNFDVVNEGLYDTSKQSWVSYKQSIFDTLTAYPNQLTGPYKFYINPQLLNNIFAAEFPFYVDTFSGTMDPRKRLIFDPNAQSGSYNIWQVQGFRPVDIYVADNFLIDADFKCYKSSIMSVHSLPKLV